MSRDITLEDTIFLPFTTRAFATGVPTVLAGTPVVSAYEDAGLTQITAGITLGVDHDSVVGFNMLTIVATAANGYENGKDYSMAITTGTVGGVSVVGEVVGEFTIGRSAAALDLANATDGLGALKAETAAILVDTAEIGSAGAGLTSVGLATGAVDADALATDAVNEIADGILDRDMSTGTDSGSTTVRTMRQALRFLRNKWSISGATLTVTKEDDSTASWTATVTTDAGADPITANDPAGP